MFKSLLFVLFLLSQGINASAKNVSEDELILHALDYKSREQNAKALEIFSFLLKETKKVEYAEEVLLLQIAQNNLLQAKNTIKAYPKLEDKIAPKTLGYIFTKLQDYKKALKYYKIDCDKHSNIQSCIILLDYYEKQKDFKSVFEVLAKLHNDFKSKNEMMKVVEIDNTINALLKQLGPNDAKIILQKLFDVTNEYDFLANLAVLEYESAKDKNEVLVSVVDKFEKSIEHSPKHMYLNFYGYLLIDHDLDYKKGLEFVKRALEADKTNDAYIDSLAWGYFKLGNCEEAKTNMKKVIDKIGLDEAEIKMHWEKIQNCEGKK